MDPNVNRLAKIIMRGLRTDAEVGKIYVAYEKEDLQNCDFFKDVVRSMQYTDARKNQFAELLVYKAKQLRRLLKNIDNKDEHFRTTVEQIEKVVEKFLRTYPLPYKKEATYKQ